VSLQGEIDKHYEEERNANAFALGKLARYDNWLSEI
jgi:hypothetical protein